MGACATALRAAGAATGLKGAIIRVGAQAAARYYSWIRPPPIASLDLALGCCLNSLVAFGHLEPKGAMWPLAVVMVDVDAENALEVAAVEDQQPVQTLGTHGPDETLCDRIRLR
jgi:hypothetical protein